MKSAFSVSANLTPSTRKDLALRVLAKPGPLAKAPYSTIDALSA